MIQDIFPHRYDTTFKRRAPREKDHVVALKDGKLLFDPSRGERGMPTIDLILQSDPDAMDKMQYMFSLDDFGFYYYPGTPEPLAGFDWRDVTSLRDFEPRWLAFGAVTGCHFGLWYVNNRFCGRCGRPNAPKGDERALCCTACGEVVFPRISPAVIVAVVDGDRLLMTRYANRPGARMMALVAGFMEVGETLEDAVRREVMEEVGLRVKNFRYYKSQPWSFSGSVLIGFFVDLDGSPEITIDRGELEEAKWFERKDVPPGLSTASLTAEMVEAFRMNRIS